MTTASKKVATQEWDYDSKLTKEEALKPIQDVISLSSHDEALYHKKQENSLNKASNKIEKKTTSPAANSFPTFWEFFYKELWADSFEEEAISTKKADILQFFRVPIELEKV
jgi:hypothetical protein